MTSQPYTTHPWELIYKLPPDEAVAKFMELRGEFLANEEQQLKNERKNAINFASTAKKGLQEIRGINYLYRARFMDAYLPPMKHLSEVYKFFPVFQLLINDSYPSKPGMSKQESENHLNNLERALQTELETITNQL